MKHIGLKVAACAFAGMIVITAISSQSNATGISPMLPVAGIARILEEGTPLEQVKEEVTLSQVAAVNIEPQYNVIDLSAPVTVESLLSTSPVATQSKVVEKHDIIASEENVKAMAPMPDIQEEKAEENFVLLASAPKQTAEEAGVEETGAVQAEVIVIEVIEEPVNEEDIYFSTLVIARVNDYVNVRSIPSEEGEILGKLYDKSVGEFISEEDGWYQITSGSVTGYVKAEYVVTGEEAIALAKEVGSRYATVIGNGLYVRKEASTDSPILEQVPNGEELSVVEEIEGWVKISVEEGEGYVSSEFVTLKTEFVKAESKEEEAARKAKEEEARKAAQAAANKAKKSTQSTSNSNAAVNIPAISGGSELGNAVAEYGCQFVGNPYVYGGSSLTNGADCSGFVMSVYANFGVSLPHSSSADRSQGYDVGGIDNAQPGDLICYSGHVGIYIGNGQIVHASTAKTGIIISNASYRKILAVRRIF